MRKTKIFWSVVVLILLLSLSVFAAGQKEGAVEKTVKFAMWGGAIEKQTVEGYLEPFLTRNPDIKVEILTPPQYWDVIQTMVAGGTPPDICYMGFPEFVDFHDKGAILNIQKYADSSKIFDKNDFVPAHLATFSDRESGELYGVPKDWSTYVVYYNEDMFRNAGLQTPWELYEKGEWTLDKFLEVAGILTNDKAHGLIFEPGRWKTFVPYFAPDWIAGTSDVKVNTREFISAIDFVKDLSLKLKVSPTADQLGDISAADRFSQQKGAMYIIGRWMAMRYIKGNLPFKWNIAPMPVGKDGRAHTWVDMVAYSILDGAKNPDIAWKIIEYLTGPEGQASVAKAGHAIPSRISVANSDAFLKSVRPGFHNEAHLAIKDAQPVLVFNNWSRVWSVFGSKLDLVWTGQKSAKEACAEIQKEIDPLLKE